MAILVNHQQVISAVDPELKTIDIAYTPDSDDVFNFYGWEHDKVKLPGYRPEVHHDHIIALNRAALQGKYDLVGISSVLYPQISERYWVLAVGNSIGRGYGPILVSKHYKTIGELKNKRIAVAGMPTTGGALAAMFVPGAELVELQYDKISDAVANDEFDAGVMIHEELLFFEKKGLRKVADLGLTWTEDTGLPLPVGLNVVSRRLGRMLARQVARVCTDSLRWSLHHYREAYNYARQFGRPDCSQQHISMFSNDDTLCATADTRMAMRVMFDRVAAIGLGPRIDHFEVIYA